MMCFLEGLNISNYQNFDGGNSPYSSTVEARARRRPQEALTHPHRANRPPLRLAKYTYNIHRGELCH